MLLAGVRQFHVNRLALFAHGLRRFGAQLGGVLLGRSRQALRFMPRVGQQRIGLGVGLAQHTLGVELSGGLAALFLQLGLQLQNRLVARLDLLTQPDDGLLGRPDCLVDAVLVISA